MVSGAPDWVPDWLLLTPGQAAGWAAFFLVLLIILDLYAKGDKIADNTPRELILKLAKWRTSPGYLPFTGAFAPFAVAVLVGHFFHPWSGAGPLGDEFPGLWAVLIMAFALAFLTGVFDPQIEGKKRVFVIAILGLIAGVVFWPVGA